MTETSSLPCAEIVTFRLVDAVSPAQFVDEAKKTLDIIRDFGGCLERNLSVDESGLWTDYILWQDRATAMRAAESIPKDPRFADFGKAIDPASVTMQHSSVEIQWVA